MSVYRDCDIRGIYKKDLDEDTAYGIGRAVGSMMKGKKLAVGGDVRVSTPALKENLIKGLLESGSLVTDIGIVPTPVFYFALEKTDSGGGVTVTASHNPPEYNGFKLMLGKMPVTPETMRDIEKRVTEKRFENGSGSLCFRNIVPEYESSLIERFKAGSLKVVVDCGNGTMSETAPRVFEKLGYRVIRLFCEFDGTFPNRDPNPAVYEHLSSLRGAVIENRADLGVAFDGDGDRVIFVDDRGETVESERSFVLIIREYLKGSPSSVVYDQKSSSIVKKTILEMGGLPLPERSGHAFIKKRFLENRSRLAGEISGHYFFGELGYDDGLYAALVMAELIEGSDKSLSSLLLDIPQPVISPDIRFPCPFEKQDALLDRIREFKGRYTVTELDGVRVEFPFGWLLVRKSVTEEAVTVRFEGDDEEAMERIGTMLLEKLPELQEHPYFKSAVKRK
jgi:phosphomannomutase/phosphoglucomutase